MTWPWEKPFDYQKFMDSHVRVVVRINGAMKGSFAVLDDGTDMNANTVMPDGTPLIFKVEGHPRTTDPEMTVAELVTYILENFKT
jgi:hypothetical protein